MRKLVISDATMKQSSEDLHLSFKEKIELCKLLDKFGVDLIELSEIKDPRVDALLIKSIVSAVGNSRIAVPVSLTSDENLEMTWTSLKDAKNPRLQVCASTSSVQIEYLFHKKPDAMIDAISHTVAACRALCEDVEFVANDATRSDGDFLATAIEAAISAGATTVTLCDTAGTMLPSEFSAFIRRQYDAVPRLSEVTLGVCCANTIAMADACAVMAITEGAGQIRTAVRTNSEVSLENVTRILSAKSDTIDAYTRVEANKLSVITSQIEKLTCTGKAKTSAPADRDDGLYLTAHDTEEAVAAATVRLGYDLSVEDLHAVYAAFSQIAGKKEKVSFRELDAIVASSAMQVPSIYKLDTYVITSGNNISATAHIKLTKNGEASEGVYIGDGAIDAAFQAIEKITGCSYELDDFQLQAVTEGREAMGQTIVKLRSGGKVYSGIGISTDIVGAGIRAYLSALNKIVYEEELE